MAYALPLILGILVMLSIYITPIAKTTATFYSGISPKGVSPTLITLIFSQVTTWIFARSLMNAAILGFFYGIWGTLAYATYYLSFLTGGLIVDRIRFQYKHNSVQDFLYARFGQIGTVCYNTLICIRLISGSICESISYRIIVRYRRIQCLFHCHRYFLHPDVGLLNAWWFACFA